MCFRYRTQRPAISFGFEINWQYLIYNEPDAYAYLNMCGEKNEITAHLITDVTFRRKSAYLTRNQFILRIAAII